MLCVSLKKDILSSTIDMLNDRYSEGKNVTVKSVLMNHIKSNFHLRIFLCRSTTKDLCNYFERLGIFTPYLTTTDNIVRDTWRINFDKLNSQLGDIQKFEKT